MFITVRQTQSNGKNLFQVEAESGILFRAQTPWADIQAPFQLENMRKLRFTDAHGSELFHTSYHVLENTMQAISRYKYLFGTSTKLLEYQVIGRDGTVLGSFYGQLDDVFTTQMTIDYLGRTYSCYDRTLGNTYVISIYDGERQIAQVTKPLDVWDRLDIFYLHLDDAYQDMLPILSFFIVYVDARKFNRPGNISGYSVEKHWSYSYDRNNDKYDPDWIRRTFGQDTADQLQTLLETHPERRPRDPEQVRKSRRRSLRIIAAVVLILAAAAAAVGWIAFRPRTPLTPEKFVSAMDSYGYTVSTNPSLEVTADWESAYEARKADCSFWYLDLPTVETAEQLFAEIKTDIQTHRTATHTQTSMDFNSYQKYMLGVDGSFYAVARIEDTVVLCVGPDTDKDTLQDILKELGY